MDLFSDIIQAVQDDLTIDDNSTLYPPALVKRAINRAKWKAEGLFRWPETEDAKKTSTEANQEYYDYPDRWRPDSIWKIKVDGEDLGDPLVFKDYLHETENDFPNGEKTIWANQWRRFFIRVDGVAPTTNGNNNICVWGQTALPALSNLNDTTIFSYSLPECNIAIAQEAVAILKTKGEDLKLRDMLSGEAKQLLTIAWGKIRQEQSKHEKTLPFFDVPDLFGRSRVKQNTGNFD